VKIENPINSCKLIASWISSFGSRVDIYSLVVHEFPSVKFHLIVELEIRLILGSSQWVHQFSRIPSTSTLKMSRWYSIQWYSRFFWNSVSHCSVRSKSTRMSLELSLPRFPCRRRQRKSSSPMCKSSRTNSRYVLPVLLRFSLPRNWPQLLSVMNYLLQTWLKYVAKITMLISMT
jgi:hypothetical protein